jgi:copper amine oxidase-like protein
MSAWGDYHKVTGAGWSVFWRIPDKEAGGLEVWWGDFHGKRVLWKGSQPFAVVPYHHPLKPYPSTSLIEPPPPEFTFKDGLGARCKGAAFTALKHWSPNARNDASWNAATDLEAVRIDTEVATSFDAGVLVISAKFQCGWYQYVQRWEFNEYGEIHADLGMGGTLHPANADKAHVHHMYFRIDLDIDGWSSDVFEVFSHNSYDDAASGDSWKVQTKQGKHLLEPKTSRKFRIRDLVSTTTPGLPPRGYEIELPAQAGTDAHSTADVWATLYRGDTTEQGETVGMAKCSDLELDKIATGAFDTAKGSDIVCWVVVRHHHEPRHLTEERDFLPYHYEGFHITPRAFEIFRPADGHGDPTHPPDHG